VNTEREGKTCRDCDYFLSKEKMLLKVGEGYNFCYGLGEIEEEDIENMATCGWGKYFSPLGNDPDCTSE